MNSVKLFDYIVNRLSELMADEYATWEIKGRKGVKLQNYGRCHTKVFSGSKVVLLSLTRNAICYGKDKYILASEMGNSLFCYNGEFFEAVEGDGIRFLKEVVRRVFMNLGIGIVYQHETAEQVAKGCFDTIVSSDEYLYTPSRRYVGFKNGVFDLDTGKLKPFDIKYKPWIALDIDFGAEKDLYVAYSKKYGDKDLVNPARLWNTKLNEIIPSPGMREALQMFCGSLLVDREKLKIEYCCFLIGCGSNGKSVLANVIAGVFGEKYFRRFTPKQLFKDSDARVNIAALENAIANLVGDLDSEEISGGDFKRFASGEKFQGRRNYKDPIQVTAPPLLCCTNQMPESSDDSWGHHRRQLPILTTEHRFTEEDKDPYLTEKLTTEDARSYIFTWIYEGYKKIIRGGGNITFDDDVKEAMTQVRDNSNSGRRWFRDMRYIPALDVSPRSPYWRSLKSLYEEYRDYAEECGYAQIIKRGDIAAMIRSMNVPEIRRAEGLFFCVDRRKFDVNEEKLKELL